MRALAHAARKLLHIAGEGLAEVAWPTSCAICDVPGALLCERCRLTLPYIDALRVCARCGQAYGQMACVECNSFMREELGLRDAPVRFMLDDLASVLRFVDPFRRVITTYKDHREVRLGAVLAEMLSHRIDPAWVSENRTALVVIPTRAEAISERGFDHMEVIGGHLAKLTGLPHVRPIAPSESEDQRDLQAADRHANVSASFAPRPLWCGELEQVILVDDVLTTGATLTAAATTLKAMGAEKVFGLTLARLP